MQLYEFPGYNQHFLTLFSGPDATKGNHCKHIVRPPVLHHPIRPKAPAALHILERS